MKRTKSFDTPIDRLSSLSNKDVHRQISAQLSHLLRETMGGYKRDRQTVCEAKTKIIPVIQLGARTQEMAYSVVCELKTRLKVGTVPIFSSDGLNCLGW